MSNPRRTVLALLAGLAGASTLSACGFRLRGAEQTRLPFKTIYLGFADNSPLGVELRRYIRASGGTEIVADRKAAEAVLEPLDERREESVLSLNSQGRIRELSLFYRFSFRVLDGSGKQLLEPTNILIKRDMSFNEAAVLAKEGEKAMLYRDMQSDLVQQILRRLAALPST
ncbi:LPS-assembly lipoprotein [Paucimonas lemoignei]|uniref:LPS-assembly lipoprotein LptE n=1 Tax=Paucimonas lemoignei TaxID=29443 RepID=A0A4R3HZ82_PAULE|nr:LPS assembly lipoprotein LptE [Paucimonas lemoignei]TCS36819.1 LPS-assembly lipoprotein [Paucimonas lemoignei]